MDVDNLVEEPQKKAKKSAVKVDIGALLVKARENRNLSANDIASQLNLADKVIIAIENNQFVQETPLAFIRGYVRSYAQKVGADVENICVEFDRQTGGGDRPIQNIQVVSNFKKSRREVNSNNFFFKLISFIIVISLLAFAGWELWKRFGPSSLVTKSQQNEIQLDTGRLINDKSAVEIGLEMPVKESSILAKNTTLADNTTAVEIDKQEDKLDLDETNTENFDETVGESYSPVSRGGTNLVEQTTDANQIKVKAEFVFNADCWVQITDANGDVLAIGVKNDGKIMPIEGVAPLSVVLGDPSAVSLTFDGSNFDLSSFSAGQKASFVLDLTN